MKEERLLTGGRRRRSRWAYNYQALARLRRAYLGSLNP